MVVVVVSALPVSLPASAFTRCALELTRLVVLEPASREKDKEERERGVCVSVVMCVVVF